jgi:hypothetical protein
MPMINRLLSIFIPAFRDAVLERLMDPVRLISLHAVNDRDRGMGVHMAQVAALLLTVKGASLSTLSDA